MPHKTNTPTIPDLAYCMRLPPARAIAYLKAKGYVISDAWEDVWQEANAKAFTVAKVAKLDILQDIKQALEKAQAEGKTGKWFEKELTPVLQAKGWWGKKEVIDEKTGEITSEQQGSPWRLQTIYQTNLQSAYNAGRYEAQMENIDDRPYWMYVAIVDDCTRPDHAALNGQIYPADDPIWNVWYPPNGWGCRCRVVPVAERELKKMGIKVSDSEGRMGTRQELISKDTGELKEVATLKIKDPTTLRSRTISPDAGFAYNPGKEAKAEKASTQLSTKRYTGSLAALAKKELTS